MNLLRVHYSYAEPWRPSRFAFHNVKLWLATRSIKAATEIEDEPIKWIFPSIMTLIKSLSFLKTHSHAKMAPDRRVATRYDRNAVNFLAAVCIAATVSYW